MNASYDGIGFSILKVHEAIWEQVFDQSGERFLCNHFGLRGTCWLNPEATTAVNFPRGPGDYVFRPGEQASPAVTLVELISRLSQPRKKLVLSMNSLIPTNPGVGPNTPVEEEILVSPYEGMETDARHGPTCKVWGIIPDHGLASLVLDLEFHTHLAPCQEDDASPVLANVWSSKDSYDPENYARTTIIEGICYFRMDRLLQSAMAGEADLARDFVVPPIRPGYKRVAPVFELNETGDALRYVVVDTEQPMSFPIGQLLLLASISVIEEKSYVKPFDALGLIERIDKDGFRKTVGDFAETPVGSTILNTVSPLAGLVNTIRKKLK